MRMRIVLLGLISVLVACDGPAPKKTLTVYAAASLTEAFTALEQPFEQAQPDIDVQFSFAGSNQLRTQLEQGAPADVFASASAGDMQLLVERNWVDPARVQPFARNRLVVIYPNDNPGRLTSLLDLARPGVSLIVADRQVPVGKYTAAMFSALRADPTYGIDFAQGVEQNIVSRELNVKQVVAKVRLGEADAGVVYVSDLTPELAIQVGQIAIPDQFNQVAIYPIAPLKDSAHAARADQFIAYVLSDSGQTTLQQFGFVAP